MPAEPTQTVPRHPEDDIITIVAPTGAAVMQQYRERGLAAAGYAIAGRIAPHRFAYSDDAGDAELFGGIRMMAATFIRAASR